MDKAALEKELLGKESPFIWKIPPVDIPHEKYIEAQTDKFENMEEENQFQWNSFIINLILSYELSEHMKNHGRALYNVRWCKDHLLQLHRRNCKEPLFSHLFSTLLYIVSVTEAVILLKSDQLDKAHEVINGWPFTSDLCSVEDSVLLGVKASLYLQYGTDGHRMALDLARRARDLDPDLAEWWFIIGIALGRLRRMEYGSITEEEKSAIEKAFALEKNASYTVHLAQVYADYSSHLFYDQQNHQEKSKRYAAAAVSRYREAITMRPNCITLKARIAHGMLRIRDREARDIPFTKKLLDEVVQASPSNSMAYHDLGYYYERFERNTKEAILCLKKSNEAGNPQALLYLISIKWQHGMHNDIIEDLKKSLTRYNSDDCQAQLLACLGACHALINDDWESAVECLHKSLLVDPSAKYLEKFQGFNSKFVDIMDLVANYVNFKTTSNKNSPKIFTIFLEFVKNIRPNIINPAGIRKYRFTEWRRDLQKVVRKSYVRPALC